MQRYLSFLGPPGSGKTTQIRLLEKRLGDALAVASVPRLLRGQPDLIDALTTGERSTLEHLRAPSSAARDRGELAPIEVDAILLAVVSRLTARVVALDGCPRGASQARLVLDNPIAVTATVVELRFPGEAQVSSLRRQLEREAGRRGAEAAIGRLHVFENKVRVFTQDTSAGLALLDAAGVPHLVLDATDSADAIHARICETIGIATESSMAHTVES